MKSRATLGGPHSTDRGIFYQAEVYSWKLETGNQGKRIVIKQFEMERMKVSKEGRNYMLQTSLILGPSAPWNFTGALRMELNRVRILIRHFSRIVV